MTNADTPTRIVLVAGPVKPSDRRGHHDYLGGCRLLAGLLSQTPSPGFRSEPSVVTFTVRTAVGAEAADMAALAGTSSRTANRTLMNLKLRIDMKGTI